MYVYLLKANASDDVSSYVPLLKICKTKQEADVALHLEGKLWSKDCLFIDRKRVNAKDKLFIIHQEFEEAGFYLKDFVHITTSKKRALGYIENLVGRKIYSRDSLYIEECVL